MLLLASSAQAGPTFTRCGVCGYAGQRFFVTSRVDYCNAILAEAFKSTTDKLQRFMNAAARVDSGTRKYDRGLTDLLHDELHWLDVPERVQYKL